MTAEAARRAPSRASRLVALVAALLLAFALAPVFWLGSGYKLDVARRALYAACLTGIWSLLAGVAGQFSFGHVAIAGIAGYAGAVWGRHVSAQVPVLGTIWVAILVGVVAAWISAPSSASWCSACAAPTWRSSRSPSARSRAS